jgi:Holliday junction resolvasome RuvABC endonuclease subunit
MNVIGVDLGVRSVHVSTATNASTISVGKSNRGEELRLLAIQFQSIFCQRDTIAFIEEPLMAGPRNIRTALQLAQVAGALMTTVPSYFVPVATWKKEIVGKGNAKKEEVAEFLKAHHAFGHALHSQDLIDATCIRLYGERQIAKIRT